MSIVTRPSGLRISLPSTHLITEQAITSPSQRRSARPFGPVSLTLQAEPNAVEQGAIIAALERGGMQLLDRFDLQPTSASSRAIGPDSRGGGTEAANPEAKFSIDLAAHEDAVLLLEQDGFYTWKFSDEIQQPSTEHVRHGVRSVQALKSVTFSVDISPSEETAKRRGIVKDVLYGKIRAIVLKFAARILVGQAIKYLERNVNRGLKKMDALDPQKWESVRDLSMLKFPADRAARVLLFVHGTFSSTVGTFGALAGTPWGQKFLEGARANYDALIGFDHATLSEDPLANASELLNLLQSIDWKLTPHFDVIAHSRGGLVFRSLVEQLLPVSNWKPYFDRAIFVAATNGGTRLAEPDNWKTLIDAYTNIAVTACRLLGMIPQAKAVTAVLGEIIEGLGAFIQYCATHAVSEGGVPGLAAMEPDGEFIKKINETQPGQPGIETSYYCAVTSEFVPRIFGGEQEPKEMSRRFIQWVAESLAHQLMGEANDLVVNTKAMTAIDVQTGNFIKDSLNFGENPQVYHTNYFIRPEVINAFTRWLRLTEPVKVSARTSGGHETGRGPINNRRRVRTGELVAQWAYPRLAEVGALVGDEVPASVDTDIIIAREDTPVGKCVQWIEEKAPSYVVIRRDYKNETLNYAFASEEILAEAKNKDEDATLLDALNLHEHQASEKLSADDLEQRVIGVGARATQARGVLLENDKPLGVLPEKRELPSATELSKMARIALSPNKSVERVQARRVMPTFNAPESVLTPKRGARRSAAQKIVCHFRAEMDEEVIVNRVVTVEVIVSREVIGRLTGNVAKEGEAEVEPDRKLIIQVIPRKNFEVVGEERVDVDPPSPNDPLRLYFDLRATHLGEGEIWVVVRQGQVSLVTFPLKPRIVEVKSAEQNRLSRNSPPVPEAPKLQEPLHQLRIWERINGDDTFYDFELQSPTLDIISMYRSASPIENRTKYVESLYEEIEKRWLSSQSDVKAFESDLRAFGGQLFDRLIPTELQQVLWDNRDKIKSIMVLSTEPFIPWELIHIKEPNKKGLPDETRFLGQMGLIRWLHDAGWPPDQLKVRKGWARYVIPDYPPQFALPEAAEEYKFLKERFKATAIEPQPNPVRELISKPGQFDLLHFACHGFAEQDNISNAQLMLEGRIEDVLEDGMKKQKYIPVYLSATTVEQYSNLRTPANRPMVTLNACQAGRTGYTLTGLGGFAQAFLRGGAGAFVGALWSVGDSPARTFTERLYLELSKESEPLNLSEAAIIAREAARTAGDATWLAYVIYGHPHMKFVK
jgi:hypothetical protein